MDESNSPSKIVLDANLKGYFFDGLVEINKKSLCPVPESILFYSSDVLGKFSLSDHFFDSVDGKVKEKILGIKLLEASQLSKDEQKKVYKEIGEVSLVLCGFFSESVNKKIIDLQYYSNLGKMAYGHLNYLSPSFLDIPSFYGMMATSFEVITRLISVLASKNKFQKDSTFSKLMKNENLSETELLVSGILPNRTTKAS